VAGRRVSALASTFMGHTAEAKVPQFIAALRNPRSLEALRRGIGHGCRPSCAISLAKCICRLPISPAVR